MSLLPVHPGADDVLESATVVPTLAEALAGCHVAYGCTARLRGVALPDLSPREAAPALLEAGAGGAGAPVGVDRPATRAGAGCA